jgi:4-amino-4-deoxy-L-arabinose transferase-like glycosyltransferase
LAGLLAFADRRWLWVLATVFQLFVYVIYVAASGGRDPHFELWGISLRVIQLPLLAALIYLSWRAPQHERPKVPLVQARQTHAH